MMVDRRKVFNILFDGQPSGPVYRVKRVFAPLRELGYDVTLVIPERHVAGESLAREAGVPLAGVKYGRIPRPSKLLDLLGWLMRLPIETWRFARFYHSEKPDVVHSVAAFFLPPIFAARLLGVPVVWHLNDTIVPARVARRLGWMLRWLGNEIVAEAKAVGLHYGLRLGQFHVVPAPIDANLFDRAAISEEGASAAINPECINVGLVANWSWVKGLDVFVEAGGLLKARFGEKLMLHIVGRQFPSQSDYCRSIEERIRTAGLEDYVVRHGFVNNPAPIMVRFDVLALTSRSEACPQVVLEAMALEVPVVATDVGGIREILLEGDNVPAGIVVPEGDAQAIADGIARLIEDRPLARRMAENGRKRVLAGNTGERCASQFAAVYEEALGCRGRKSKARCA